MDKVKERTAVVFDQWSSWWDRAYRLNQAVYEAVVTRLGSAHLSVLDVGCGTGTLARLLALAADRRTVRGVDLSQRMVERAQGVAALFPNGRVQFGTGDAEALPYSDESFDAVTNTLSFHHFPNPQLALREIHRVLRPGGVLVMVDVAPPLVVARLFTWANLIYRPIAGAEWVRTPSEIIALLEGAGFCVDEVAPVSYFLPARVFVGRRR